MRFEHVDFPDDLLEAQSNGTLVVFAGAGVSMTEPTNYPSFPELAHRIARDQFKREDNEPIDRFLGRIEKQGVRVHRLAREILSDRSSRYNPLHLNLLRLFPSASAVRLVTTNFDGHFTTAASEEFGEGFEQFCAPALPLGNNFNGIVYLHGSVEKEETRLVVTDVDFGRAYLTEGWATRFLHAMFAQYTVLFVGYGHNDPVMNYLARGLPPDITMPRFALTPNGSNARWEFLGITPVIYPRPSDSHEALGRAVARWVEFIRMGTLDHEHRIRDIASNPPPLDVESIQYMESALKTPAMTRFFTRYAKTPEWLRWAEARQVFKPLFQPGNGVDEISQEIAWWLARDFACQHPDEALGVVQRHGLKLLHPALWTAIAHSLWTAQKSRLPAPVLARWVAVLLNSSEPNFRSELLDYILHDCKHPEDDRTAILIFEHLTRPRVQLKQGFRLGATDNKTGEQTEAEIKVEGSRYWLRKSWQKLFQPSMATFAEHMAPMLALHLLQANLFLRSAGRANDNWDPMSFRRAAVEVHEQNAYEDDAAFLVDAARDVLEWFSQHQPDRARALVDAWAVSEAPLLRRLAIHGLAEDNRMSPDAKIKWIMDRNWLYDTGLKHEVFRLLKAEYPHTAKSVRRTLLRQVERGPRNSATKKLRDRTVEYEIYNLLQWLSRADPSCTLVSQKLAAMVKRHPDFAPRPQPDLTHTLTVGWVGPESPLNVGQLLAMDPQKEIHWLLTYQEQRLMGPSREGLLLTVEEAVSADSDWGWRLVGRLRAAHAWESDVWDHIFRGWRGTSFNDDQWAEVLALLGVETALLTSQERLSAIMELLTDGLEKDEHTIPSSQLAVAEAVVRRIWGKLLLVHESVEDSADDWLLAAINHPAGRVARFWLHGLSRRRAEAGKEWAGIPTGYKNQLEQAANSAGTSAELARTALASHLHFLYALDPEWTTTHILPLMDWSIDRRRAQQAWHGFLCWGRWSEALLPDLMPLYEQTFDHVSRDLGRYRDRLSEHMAHIALYSSANPAHGDWLWKFIAKVETKDRGTWAFHIGHELQGLKDEAVVQLWTSWLHRYWQERIRGVPVSLDDAELGAMIEWLLGLGPVLDEAVALTCETNAPTMSHDLSFYHSLAEWDYVNRWPEAVARLLHHLLPVAQQPFWAGDEVEGIVRGLIALLPHHPPLLAVCDDLARLGCVHAGELRDQLLH